MQREQRALLEVQLFERIAAEVVLKAAAEGGIAEGTLYCAKRALRVRSRHQSFYGPCVWALPDAQLPKPAASRRRHHTILTMA